MTTPEDKLRAAMRKTGWGRLLIRCGHEPHEAGPMARLVAERAASSIRKLRRDLKDAKDRLPGLVDERVIQRFEQTLKETE